MINEIICAFWLGYPFDVFYFQPKCLKEEEKIIDTDNHNGADSMSLLLTQTACFKTHL